MLAARFISIGYAMAAVAAFAAAGQIGPCGALMLAWIGGALLTLLLAVGWYFFL